MLPSIKKYLFHQRVVNFVNKLELSYQKYWNNVNVRDATYKGKLLIPLK